MSIFSMLTPAIQKYMWDEKWEQFTPIQELAIPAILTTQDHVILSAGTASGKTEAAFFPVLSAVSGSAQQSLQVLYIAPLKALINDQFERIDHLCKHLGVQVHKWHGDVDGGKKRRFVQEPKGILQITPESLESLFINRTSLLHRIFRHLTFIVIDELHAFVGSERGVHLRSLLSRIETYSLEKPRIVALSATINDDGTIRRWIDAEQTDRVRVLETSDSGDKETLYALAHYPLAEKAKIPLEIYEDIHQLTAMAPAMIFCNSRGLVEESAVILNRLSERSDRDKRYLVHHSSIDKEERAHAENLLKNSKPKPSVICTSTLELGIDIGEMGMVIQIDSTFTVSSLKQRVGRTGRRGDDPQILQMYTTGRDSLLQATAVTELFLEKWVEPSEPYALPLDVLFHQLLSLCAERNGVLLHDLLGELRKLSIFEGVSNQQMIQLAEHMIQHDYLEVVPGREEMIVGLEGERILRSKEFYSVFMVSEEYEVYNGHKRIGTLDKTPAVIESANVILSGKLWTIQLVDDKKEKVYVIPAVNAKRPIFLGSSAMIHRKIGEQMMRVVCSDKNYPYLNEEGIAELRDIRQPFHQYSVKSHQRLAQRREQTVLFHLFAGSKIAYTFVWMLRCLGYQSARVESLDRVIVENVQGSFISVIQKVLTTAWTESELLPFVRATERLQTKFSIYLPESLQDEMHISGRVVVNDTLDFLRAYQVIEI